MPSLLDQSITRHQRPRSLGPVALRFLAAGLCILSTAAAQGASGGKCRLVTRTPGEDFWSNSQPSYVKNRAAWKRPSVYRIPYRYKAGEEPEVQRLIGGAEAFPYDSDRIIVLTIASRGKADSAAGYQDYKLLYEISTDGGKTFRDPEPFIEKGYTPEHPNKYVWIGKNVFAYSVTQTILHASNGELVFPFYYAPLDEHGELYNPLHMVSYTNNAVMIGTWNAKKDDLTWKVSEPISLPLDASDRGASESVLAELSTKGHFLLSIRANSGPSRPMPGYAWKSLSTDYCRTWSAPTPLTYSDGEKFYAPGSCAGLIRSSRNHKLYWIGNITPTPPNGGLPRYPLVIAEVDEQKMGLVKSSVTVLDDLQPGDDPKLQLSNFRLMDDAESGHILIHLNRMNAHAKNPKAVSGPQTYVVEVP